MSKVVYLNGARPGDIWLYHSREGNLMCVCAGEQAERVKLARCFPYSMPEQFISIREYDTNREVALLPGLEKLDEESRSAARLELERSYIIPRIERILSIRKKGQEWLWSVDTDYGTAILRMSILHEGIHELSDGRWIITDDEQRRYELSGMDKMDANSREQWGKLV